VDKDGAARALLSVEDDQPRLLPDEQGNTRISLTLDSNGSPTLALEGSGGALHVVLATAPDGSPVFGFVDAGGELRFRVVLEEAGTGTSAPEGREERSEATSVAATVDPDAVDGMERNSADLESGTIDPEKAMDKVYSDAGTRTVNG
jgi:hypothetical protein